MGSAASKRLAEAAPFQARVARLQLADLYRSALSSPVPEKKAQLQGYFAQTREVLSDFRTWREPTRTQAAAPAKATNYLAPGPQVVVQQNQPAPAQVKIASAAPFLLTSRPLPNRSPVAQVLDAPVVQTQPAAPQKAQETLPLKVVKDSVRAAADYGNAPLISRGAVKPPRPAATESPSARPEPKEIGEPEGFRGRGARVRRPLGQESPSPHVPRTERELPLRSRGSNEREVPKQPPREQSGAVPKLPLQEPQRPPLIPPSRVPNPPGEKVLKPAIGTEQPVANGRDGAPIPVTVKPATGQHGTGRENALKPGAGQPPGAGKDDFNKPGIGQPGTAQPGTGKPDPSQPGTGPLPNTGHENVLKPGAGQLPGSGKDGFTGQIPSTGKDGFSKPVTGQLPNTGHENVLKPGAGQLPGSGKDGFTG